MKKSNTAKFTLKFANARIEENDGVFIIIETDKKGNEETHDLSAELSEIIGMEGLTFSITREEEI